MPAKTPIYLKTATPKRGQKLRLRDVLSSDMISPPLGDFRHSAHIGLDGEGDMFGELSFLQGRYDVLPRLLSRRQGGPPGPEPPRRALLKTAVSLPAFSGGGVPGSEQAPPKPPRLHLEEAPPGGGGGGGGGRKPLQHPPQQHHPQHPPQQQQRSMSVSCAEGCFHHAQAGGGPSFSARGYDPLPSSVSFSSAGPPPPEGTFAGGPPLSPELPRSESLLQLDLDLGPSILDDVLRIMEEYQRPQGPVASPPLGSPCP